MREIQALASRLVSGTLLAFIAVVSVGTTGLEGQSESEARVWISAAVGAARGPDIGGGLAGIGQLNGHTFRHHAGLRLSVIADVVGFPDSGGDEVVVEVAALYGRGSGGESGYRYLAVGPSVVSVNDCDDLLGSDCEQKCKLRQGNGQDGRFSVPRFSRGPGVRQGRREAGSGVLSITEGMSFSSEVECHWLREQLSRVDVVLLRRGGASCLERQGSPHEWLTASSSQSVFRARETLGPYLGSVASGFVDSGRRWTK